MIISCGIFLSCQGNKSEETNFPQPIVEKPKPPITPLPQKPEEEEKMIYRWYYKGGIDNFSSVGDLNECPVDFAVDGFCDTALSLCKKKISVYACYPENLEIWISGKVVDESEQPIENVKINGSLGLDGYNEMATTYTKKNGKFILRVQNYCVPIIIALKDGYTSMLGKPNAMALTRCKVDNFVGAKDIVLHLKKASRSTNTVEAKSEENFCRIGGRILNRDGSGLAEVKIFNGRHDTLSDKDGNYVIEKNEKCDNYCTMRKDNYRVLFPENNKGIVSCFQGQPHDVIFVPM